ncbi:MAG: histidine ammonia-lyase [Sphingobacteriaceae bacterium]|nr:histidine ammonia-lyase [Sphingobacteriaceae bacterium]
MMQLFLGGKLSFTDLQTVLEGEVEVTLSEDAKARIQKGKSYLDGKLTGNKELFYGINTGFGALCNVGIQPDALSDLQHNLIRSHACGMGQEVPHALVRLMLVLKIQSLAYGHSGVALKTVERLVDFYNAQMLPVVYQQGSLGASGDLAPLAHLCLPLIGEGEVQLGTERLSAAAALQRMGWQPLHLEAKEGLALLNGTQFMTAYGCYAILAAEDLLQKADLVAAASLDAFGGRLEPFHPAIHQVRPHPGQQQVAAHMLDLLQGSELQKQERQAVQDPYSFRCVPQVHGASRDVCKHVKEVFSREMNAVSDNPNIFPEEDLIISGGNFHGQPLALALDYLAMALSELGSISERRTYQLISGTRGLPPFLAVNSGLHSGLMIPQYTAASIASQNKQLTVPASTDSIVSSNGQEDHVSMGANAATKLFQVVDNAYRLLAIEWLTACQALDFRDAKSSEVIEKHKQQFRNQVSFMQTDRFLHADMVAAETFLRSFEL